MEEQIPANCSARVCPGLRRSAGGESSPHAENDLKRVKSNPLAGRRLPGGRAGRTGSGCAAAASLCATGAGVATPGGRRARWDSTRGLVAAERGRYLPVHALWPVPWGTRSCPGEKWGEGLWLRLGVAGMIRQREAPGRWRCPGEGSSDMWTYGNRPKGALWATSWGWAGRPARGVDSRPSGARMSRGVPGAGEALAPLASSHAPAALGHRSAVRLSMDHVSKPGERFV